MDANPEDMAVLGSRYAELEKDCSTKEQQLKTLTTDLKKARQDRENLKRKICDVMDIPFAAPKKHIVDESEALNNNNNNNAAAPAPVIHGPRLVPELPEATKEWLKQEVAKQRLLTRAQIANKRRVMDGQTLRANNVVASRNTEHAETLRLIPNLNTNDNWRLKDTAFRSVAAYLVLVDPSYVPLNVPARDGVHNSYDAIRRTVNNLIRITLRADLIQSLMIFNQHANSVVADNIESARDRLVIKLVFFRHAHEDHVKALAKAAGSNEPKRKESDDDDSSDGDYEYEDWGSASDSQ